MKNSGSFVDKTLHMVEVQEAHNLLPAAHKRGHLIAVYLPPVSACRNSLIPVSKDSEGGDNLCFVNSFALPLCQSTIPLLLHKHYC
jgi:hypothetical protein